jgi:hypothetical protein
VKSPVPAWQGVLLSHCTLLGCLDHQVGLDRPGPPVSLVATGAGLRLASWLCRSHSLTIARTVGWCAGLTVRAGEQRV